MRSGTRGFALLIVLWLLVPLSILFAMLAGAARSDAQLTGNLRDAAGLEAAADGAINTAIFDLLQSPRPRPLRARVGGAEVAAEVVSLSGLVNPNIVSAELLRALLLRLGAEPDRAAHLAAAIVDWRAPGERASVNGAKAAEYRAAGRDYGPPGAPFQTVGELGEVLGMTPGLLAALRPYVSLFADRAPDPADAPAPVRAALADTGVRNRGGEAGDVFRITATADGTGGGRVVRRATVRIGFTANGRGWRVLAWETGGG